MAAFTGDQKRKKHTMLHSMFRLLNVFSGCLAGTFVMADSIRPPARDYVVAGESPDPENVPLYNPGLVRIGSGPQAGRLLGCSTSPGSPILRITGTTRTARRFTC
jgi:hypothetical protein